MSHIMGNRDGLEALRDAIDRALEDGEGIAKVMVADGEGYDLVVSLNDSDWQSKEWQHLRVPYWDDAAKENRPSENLIPHWGCSIQE